MKKILENIGIETVFGGLFGFIAIVATMTEMVIAGFDAGSIAGGVKDISGTLITVVMLVVAINALQSKKKVTGDFEATFNEKMQSVIDKYYPMITFYGEETSENYKGYYRYNVANKLDCVTTNEPGGNNKLFRIKKEIKEIEFSVSATVFGKNKEAVSARVASRIKNSHSDLVFDYKITATGFTLVLNESLKSDNDANNIVDVIEHILILYMAEYHRE